jgi:hypothetical protein
MHHKPPTSLQILHSSELHYRIQMRRHHCILRSFLPAEQQQDVLLHGHWLSQPFFGAIDPEKNHLCVGIGEAGVVCVLSSEKNFQRLLKYWGSKKWGTSE